MNKIFTTIPLMVLTLFFVTCSKEIQQVEPIELDQQSQFELTEIERPVEGWISYESTEDIGYRSNKKQKNIQVLKDSIEAKRLRLIGFQGKGIDYWDPVLDKIEDKIEFDLKYYLINIKYRQLQILKTHYYKCYDLTTAEGRKLFKDKFGWSGNNGYGAIKKCIKKRLKRPEEYTCEDKRIFNEIKDYNLWKPYGDLIPYVQNGFSIVPLENWENGHARMHFTKVTISDKGNLSGLSKLRVEDKALDVALLIVRFTKKNVNDFYTAEDPYRRRSIDYWIKHWFSAWDEILKKPLQEVLDMDLYKWYRREQNYMIKQFPKYIKQIEDRIGDIECN